MVKPDMSIRATRFRRRPDRVRGDAPSGCSRRSRRFRARRGPPNPPATSGSSRQNLGGPDRSVPSALHAGYLVEAELHDDVCVEAPHLRVPRIRPSHGLEGRYAPEPGFVDRVHHHRTNQPQKLRVRSPSSKCPLGPHRSRVRLPRRPDCLFASTRTTATGMSLTRVLLEVSWHPSWRGVDASLPRMCGLPRLGRIAGRGRRR